MSEYFKMYTESHGEDEGVFYCEVQNGIIVRHVSIFNNIYYWATSEKCFDEQYDFTDQPDFGELEEGTRAISQMEFETIWGKAINQ